MMLGRLLKEFQKGYQADLGGPDPVEGLKTLMDWYVEGLAETGQPAQNPAPMGEATPFLPQIMELREPLKYRGTKEQGWDDAIRTSLGNTFNMLTAGLDAQDLLRVGVQKSLPLIALHGAKRRVPELGYEAVTKHKLLRKLTFNQERQLRNADRIDKLYEAGLNKKVMFKDINGNVVDYARHMGMIEVTKEGLHGNAWANRLPRSQEPMAVLLNRAMIDNPKGYDGFVYRGYGKRQKAGGLDYGWYGKGEYSSPRHTDAEKYDKSNIVKKRIQLKNPLLIGTGAPESHIRLAEKIRDIAAAKVHSDSIKIVEMGGIPQGPVGDRMSEAFTEIARNLGFDGVVKHPSKHPDNIHVKNPISRGMENDFGIKAGDPELVEFYPQQSTKKASRFSRYGDQFKSISTKFHSMSNSLMDAFAESLTSSAPNAKMYATLVENKLRNQIYVDLVKKGMADEFATTLADEYIDKIWEEANKLYADY